jgi:hypothetical protein
MKMGASDRFPAAMVSFGQSLSLRKPVLRFVPSTKASEQSIRIPNCSFDISNEKIPIGIFFWIAAHCATLRQKAVFPMLGLPAIIIRSEGWKPAVNRSRSLNPDGTPVIRSFFS